MDFNAADIELVRQMVARGEGFLLDDHQQEIAQELGLKSRPELRSDPLNDDREAQLVDGVQEDEPDDAAGDRLDGGYDTVPRWLLYSRLSECLTAPQWAVFVAIVQLDHQTRRVRQRRRGRDGARFVAPIEDICIRTGYRRTAVGTALRALSATRLMSYEARKGRGRWPEFEVHMDAIATLCAYVAPRLRGMHGGIASKGKLTDLGPGFRIYGNGDHELVADLEIVRGWQRSMSGRIEAPDPERVAALCGIVL